MEGFHGHFSSVGLDGHCRWGGGALHACDGSSPTKRQQHLCAHMCTENSLAHHVVTRLLLRGLRMSSLL